MKIRPATLDDCPAIAKIQVESYQSTYAGIFPPTYLAHFTQQEQEADWREMLDSSVQDTLLVAEVSSDQLAGYALAGPNRDDSMPYDGELIALHISRQFQRQQIGTGLFSTVCARLQQQNITSVFLWVLEANPARTFYEKRCGQLVSRKPWINNAYFSTDIYEVAYGWESIQTLLDLTN